MGPLASPSRPPLDIVGKLHSCRALLMQFLHVNSLIYGSAWGLSRVSGGEPSQILAVVLSQLVFEDLCGLSSESLAGRHLCQSCQDILRDVSQKPLKILWFLSSIKHYQGNQDSAFEDFSGHVCHNDIGL
jgi:hypothetical protein